MIASIKPWSKSLRSSAKYQVTMTHISIIVNVTHGQSKLTQKTTGLSNLKGRSLICWISSSLVV